MKKFVRFVLKLLAVVAAAVLMLAVILVLSLRTIPVQEHLAERVSSVINERTGLDVGAERLIVLFPGYVGVENLIVGASKGDSLLYAGHFGADVNMFSLFKNRVEVKEITIEDLHLRLKREEHDSLFNYEYILKAFAEGAKEETRPPSETSTSWTFSAEAVRIKNAKAGYADYLTGTSIEAGIGMFTCFIEEMDLPGQMLHFKKIGLEGTYFDLTSPDDSGREREKPQEDLHFRLRDVFDWSIKADILDIAGSFFAMRTAGIKENPVAEGLLTQGRVGGEPAERNVSAATFNPSDLSFSDINALFSSIKVAPDTAAMSIDRMQWKLDGGFELSDISAEVAAGRDLQMDKLVIESSHANIDASFSAGINVLDFTPSKTGDFPFSATVTRGEIDGELARFFPGLDGYLDTEMPPLSFLLEAGGRTDRIAVDRFFLDAPGLAGAETETAFIEGLFKEEGPTLNIPRLSFWAHTPGIMTFIPEGAVPGGIELPDTLNAVVSFSGNRRSFGSYCRILTSAGDVEADVLYFAPQGEIPFYKMAVDVTGLNLYKLGGTEEPPGRVDASANIEGWGFDPKEMDSEFDLALHSFELSGYDYKGLLLDGSIREGILGSAVEYDDENLSFSFEGETNLTSEVPGVRGRLDLRHMDARALNFSQDHMIIQTIVDADLVFNTPGFAEGSLEISNTGVHHEDDYYSFESLMVNSAFSDGRYRVDADSPFFEALYDGNFSPAGLPGVMSGLLSEYFEFGLTETEDITHEDKNFDLNVNIYPSPWYTDFLFPALESFDPFKIESRFDGETGSFSLSSLIPFVRYEGTELRDFSLKALTRQETLDFSLFLPEFETGEVSLRNLTATGELKDDILGFSVSFDETGHDDWFSLSGAVRPDEGGFEMTFDREAVMGGYMWRIEEGNFVRFGGEMPVSGKISLESQGARIDLSGSYITSNTPEIDLELGLSQLDVALFGPFLPGEVDEPEGIVNANIMARGSMDSPELSGDISFLETAFYLHSVNSRFFIPGDTLLFREDNIILSNFTLTDSQGTKAELNGKINLRSYNDPHFDLGLTTSNFMAMDVPQGYNDLYYGRLFIDSDINLRGGINSLVARGGLRLNEGSYFTMVVPQTLPDAIGDRGVVEFIPPGEHLYPVTDAAPLFQPAAPSAFKTDLSINIEVDPGTDLRVIIDELAGDYIELRGGGAITYGTDARGQTFLSGRYEIARGSYRMSFYDLIRRNFSIQKGSSVVWTGDPMEADVDISASYSVRTSPLELMAHQTEAAGRDPAMMRHYPFQVQLKMRGDLMHPEIEFEITLPPEHRDAMDGMLQARLDELNRDESQLNKQVFALLTLGGFIRESPFATAESGAGLTSAARASASRVLSQQLNRMSGRYIRGVDLNFEVESYEDYAPGGKAGTTDLHMEVSKDFFDERMRITAGGNIELEDERRRQLSPGDIAGDFSLEYLLAPDGSIILKGYRRSEFYDIFEGEVTETGMSLIFTKTYNRIRELFERDDENR